MASANAQTIQGKATYKTQRKMEVKMDSSQMGDAMQEEIFAMIKEQFKKEYILDFDQNQSIYKEVEKLGKPSAKWSTDFQVDIVGSGAGDVLYTNKKENRYTNQSESFSKLFLIQDSLKLRDWKLEKETKNIGDYTCFKASYTYERTELSCMSFDDAHGSDEKLEEKKEMVTVVAWYTPQIPVSLGPDRYEGLPGLILEVSDGDLSVLCSRIVLNPKGGVDVTEPKGGKKVSQADYDAIMEKKMDEMTEQFRDSRSRRGDGDQIEIRIGG
jgi:GLPGLI family protein